MAAANRACACGSTGRCLILVLAASLPRQLSFFQFLDGLIGLGPKPPPQFGQTLSRMVSTQVAQKVHSYEQMRASSAAGGKGLLQFSQLGLNSSMIVFFSPRPQNPPVSSHLSICGRRSAPQKGSPSTMK